MSSKFTPSTNSPIVSIAAWVRDERRTGINPRTGQEFNDPHFNVKVQLNTVKLAKIVAEALAKGQVSVEILGSLWANEGNSTSDPAFTGHADVTRAQIEARKLAEAAAQAQAALEAAALLQTGAPEASEGEHEERMTA